jgi:hypothetical protein
MTRKHLTRRGERNTSARPTRSSTVFTRPTILLLFTLLCARMIAVGAVFPVLTTSDVAGPTLRAAIMNANLSPGRDTIIFGIPGGGAQTIGILAPLPQLIDMAGVLIDGFSQFGSAIGPNPPASLILMIIVDGTNAGFAHGFHIVSPLNEIRGLVIQNFQRDGIRVQATAPQPGTHSNVIYGNIIGTNVAGTLARGNGTSRMSPYAGVNILVDPMALGIVQNNVVRHCLVSANYSDGVSISSCPPGDAFLNHVVENFIGTTLNGMSGLGNIVNGVYIGEAAHDNVVLKNLISANDTDGVCIVGYVDQSTQWYTRRNILDRNIIGLAVDRLTPLPNKRHGVSIGRYGQVWTLGYAPENVVMSDTIAHNGGCGIMVWEHPSSMNNTDMNRITQNAIYANGRLGIDLNDDGVSTNDVGDLDSTANQCLNMPVITGAAMTPIPGAVMVSGTVAITTPPATATVEVFKARSDPTGYGEGAQFLAAIAPNNAGNWSVTVFNTNLGDTLTATVTDLSGNTSEFSQGIRVVVPVELLAFSGEAIGDRVRLRWTTASESGNAGFAVQRCDDVAQWLTIGWEAGHGTTTMQQTYSYDDRAIHGVGTGVLHYRLKQIDYDGTERVFPEIAVRPRIDCAHAFFSEPYPQPAHREGSIFFELPDASTVELSLHDASGRIVSTLLAPRRMDRGAHLLHLDLRAISPGSYLLRCTAGDAVAYRRLVVRR